MVALPLPQPDNGRKTIVMGELARMMDNHAYTFMVYAPTTLRQRVKETCIAMGVTAQIRQEGVDCHYIGADIILLRDTLRNRFADLKVIPFPEVAKPVAALAVLEYLKAGDVAELHWHDGTDTGIILDPDAMLYYSFAEKRVIERWPQTKALIGWVIYTRVSLPVDLQKYAGAWRGDMAGYDGSTKRWRWVQVGGSWSWELAA